MLGTDLKDTDDMQADVHMQVEVFRNKSEALLNSYVCSKLTVWPSNRLLTSIMHFFFISTMCIEN